jgi:hypothetical protein
MHSDENSPGKIEGYQSVVHNNSIFYFFGYKCSEEVKICIYIFFFIVNHFVFNFFNICVFYISYLFVCFTRDIYQAAELTAIVPVFIYLI